MRSRYVGIQIASPLNANVYAAYPSTVPTYVELRISLPRFVQKSSVTTMDVWSCAPPERSFEQAAEYEAQGSADRCRHVEDRERPAAAIGREVGGQKAWRDGR